MANPIITIHDLETGEEIQRPMTKSEFEQYKDRQNERAEELESIAAKAAARQSALEKLAALGLTEAEIQALAG